MDLRIVHAMRNARKPIELNAKEGSRVLIVADTRTEPLVWQALSAACVEVGAEPTVAIMTPRPHPQAEPTPEIAAAMLQADINVLVPSRAVLHSKAGHRAMKEGHPCIAAEELSVEMLCQGATTADYPAMQGLGRALLRVLNEGSSVRLTSEAGTDLRSKIGGGRKGWCVAGIINKQEGGDLYCAAFPDGEVGTVPLEGTGEGTVVWDTSAHVVGLVREPVRITVRNGVAVDISGGSQADAVADFLRTSGDENSYNLAEIAIGINPKSRITGSLREDKKLYGSVHIALGMSSDTGGLVDSKTHLDGVIRYPSLWVDDRLIVERGRILVEA